MEKHFHQSKIQPNSKTDTLLMLPNLALKNDAVIINPELRQLSGKYNLTLPRSLETAQSKATAKEPTKISKNWGICRRMTTLILIPKKISQQITKSVTQSSTSIQVVLALALVALTVLTVMLITRGVERYPPFGGSSDHHHNNCWQWQELLQQISGNPELHFQVYFEDGRISNTGKPEREQLCEIIKYTKRKPKIEAVAVVGRPSFCIKQTPEAPKGIELNEITHLHLKYMADCNHYLQLILTDWKFPKIYHIKLQWVVIEEKEFSALTTFIDRHNKTLQKVEIDESYLCPSPACDAGMINLPNHDFEVIITGRKESVKMMK